MATGSPVTTLGFSVRVRVSLTYSGSIKNTRLSKLLYPSIRVRTGLPVSVRVRVRVRVSVSFSFTEID